jgi:hypothetical protein
LERILKLSRPLLYNQDLNAVKAAVSDLAQKAQAANNETILKDANDLAKTESIDQARQVFKTLSDDTLHLISTAEGSQETAGSRSGMQCMQTTNQSSCMGSTTLTPTMASVFRETCAIGSALV